MNTTLLKQEMKNIEEYAQTLCETLEENFKQDSIASYKYRNGSVHAFIDRETGDVYKPAGWAKPAKHVRYNLLERKDREFLFDYKNVGWAGGYLYMR